MAQGLTTSGLPWTEQTNSESHVPQAKRQTVLSVWQAAIGPGQGRILSVTATVTAARQPAWPGG